MEKCKKGYRRVKGKCVNVKKNYKIVTDSKLDKVWAFVSIIGIFFLVIFVLGYNNGLFNYMSIVEDNNLINSLNNAEKDSQCSLDITEGQIYVGDTIKEIVINNERSFCQLFYKDGNTWLKIYQGYSDKNGIFFYEHKVKDAGSFTLRAICDINKNNLIEANDCITNAVYVDFSQK